MGAGIAKQIKERYPEAYEADTQAKKDGYNKLGYFSYAKVCEEPERWVVNVYGQDDIGGERATNYEGLYQALNTLMIVAKNTEKEIIVGVPKFMGCGLAGGSWRIVSAMLEDLEQRFETEIVCVELES